MSKCSVVACTVGYFKGVTNMLRPIVLDDSIKICTLVGLEPTASGLEVRRAIHCVTRAGLV